VPAVHNWPNNRILHGNGNKYDQIAAANENSVKIELFNIISTIVE